jgi:DNA-binding NtrC family response regulator
MHARIHGNEVLGQIKQISPETQVIILTGHATVDTAGRRCGWAHLIT